MAEQSLELLRELVSGPMAGLGEVNWQLGDFYEHSYTCVYCDDHSFIVDNKMEKPVEHRPECPIRRGRELLAQADKVQG